MVSEYLDEARFGPHAFVIRAEPTGMPGGVGSLSIWIELGVHVRRFVTRERTWTVRVRRREEDPFGKVVYQEIAPDGKEARRRLEELKEEVRSGKLRSLSS